MKLSDDFFDDNFSFKGYEVTLFRKDQAHPFSFRLTDEEFEANKELVIRLDFLIKTNQWIPYAIYKDLIDLPEDNYPGLRVIENIDIPVPPIKEQERIINILDRFDALCNDISACLPAEIEARQKQYEYYRDKILTF